MPVALTWVRNRRLCAGLFLVFLLSQSIISTSRATEQLSSQTFLIQAPSYELHIVTLRGVIRDMQAMPPIPMGGKCRLLYGHATFVLEDDTGFLPVGVFGSCTQQAVASLPKDGDQVALDAVIFISKGEVPVRVWGQATEIRLIPDGAK